MQTTNYMPHQLDPKTRAFYLRSMEILDRANVEYLVGGAYSLAHHAGVVRHTKDFDVFVRKQHAGAALSAFERAGYRTEVTFPHWLSKAFQQDEFVDVIYGSGNGLCPVDDEWFAHAVDGAALGRAARLAPAEEIIWTKAFVQERERFDGADIAHVLLAQGQRLDWDRLLRRFAGHEQVLLAHLILFTYIYPSEYDEKFPRGVIGELHRKIASRPAVREKICFGTLLSRAQYLKDIGQDGFKDARLQPLGQMSEEDVAHWTAAINTIR
jgi:hypothetical protein